MLTIGRIVALAASLLSGVVSAQVIFQASPNVQSQGPPLTAPAGNIPPDQKCVLQGRATNALTGEPLKKVNVRLARRGSRPGFIDASQAMMLPRQQGYSTTSDADGNFRIEAIDPGDYILSGQRNGYLASSYGAKRPMGPGTIVTLRPGQQMTGITLGLSPQAVISGKVVDEDGDPAPNAMLQVLTQSWQRGKLRTLPRGGSNTNDLGEFRVADLPPGKYYMCARMMYFNRGDEPEVPPGKPDIRPIRTCYPDATALGSATPIEIAVGQDVSDVTIRLHSAQTYHVRGKITGNLPTGEMQRVNISIAPREEDMLFFGTNHALMNKDQTFDIPGVAPGPYTVNVFLVGGNLRGIAHQPVEVGQGDVNDLVLAITPPGSLRGSVRLDGVPQSAANAAANLANVRVSLSPADSGTMFGPTPNAQSKSDGTFTLDNVFPGKYYVETNAPPGTYLKSVLFGQQEILGKELDLSQAVSGDLEIVFRFGAAEVDGSLQSAENSAAASPSAPVPEGAVVVLVPDVLNADGSGMHSASTNQNGTFTMRNVPPGHYRAYAFEDLHMDVLQNPDVLKQLEGRGTEVEVKENDRKQIQLPLISSDDLQQIFARLGIDSSQ